MQTVTTAEASKSLPDLLEQVKNGPVLIREGDQDVAVLVSSEEYRTAERQRKFAELKKLRNDASEEFQRNLAKDGLNVEDFLADVLG